jgi:4-hydroxybenzoyl-CoA thioesterase
MDESSQERSRPGSLTLRFLAAPTDVAFLDDSAVAGGRVLKWIDKAAFGCAAGWCATYCVTAYVGNVNFVRPIHAGDLVEVAAQLVLTGRSSMHVLVTVRAGPIMTGPAEQTTSCIVVFVAVDEDGRPTPVPPWEPATEQQRAAAEDAGSLGAIRQAIEQEMATQMYSQAGTAPSAVMRFIAAPTDVNWGGKTHGGTVMRWIDEAAWACAVRWSGMDCLTAFSGGICFYRPIPIGNIVEVAARLLHTGRTSMHISVHVSSADPKTGEFELTTHCLTVFVALADGKPAPVRPWIPVSEEDRRLDAGAVRLMQLRAGRPIKDG